MSSRPHCTPDTPANTTNKGLRFNQKIFTQLNSCIIEWYIASKPDAYEQTWKIEILTRSDDAFLNVPLPYAPLHFHRRSEWSQESSIWSFPWWKSHNCQKNSMPDQTRCAGGRPRPNEERFLSCLGTPQAELFLFVHPFPPLLFCLLLLFVSTFLLPQWPIHLLFSHIPLQPVTFPKVRMWATEQLFCCPCSLILIQ